MDDPDPAGLFSVLLSAAAGGDISLPSALVRILILFLLILVNAFFAMSEIAVISVNDAKIQKLAENGDRKAARLLRLISNSSDFLSTIQIGVTLAGFLASAVSSASFAPALAKAINTRLPDVSYDLLYSVCLVVITIITSYFSLVFGELTPKKIAMHNPEKISYLVCGVLLFCKKIAKPFVKLLAASTNALCRLLGFDPNADAEKVTEEELLLMLDAGEESGVIENSQKEMINNIFEFDDLDAGDIMTHRVDMTAIDVEDSIDDVVKLAIEDGFSRIPAYEEDPDNIVGVIYVKDLLKYVGADMPQNVGLRDIMREAFYVPESIKCGKLFSQMSENHIQMAVVVDEYGGTAGILTFEDLVEAIVGNISDEYDRDSDEISKINDNTFTVDGTTDIDEIDELLGVELPEGDYDTVAGFIISRLGYLPKDGDFDRVEYKNLVFTVLSVDERRIDTVKIEIIPDTQSDQKNEDKT
ncbi:MAG: hemolysin family protein [Clostridia bacterium]|nr:hemolysin family protein [Clostridia bacterium]